MEENKFTDATPDYYNDGDISCIEAMVAAKGLEKTIAFCECCAFKYEWRLGKKDSVGKEVSKIKKYLDLYLELSERLECERLGKKKGEVEIIARGEECLGIFEATMDIIANVKGEPIGHRIYPNDKIFITEVCEDRFVRAHDSSGKEFFINKECFNNALKPLALPTITDLKKKGLTQRQIDDILKK